jgi:hypothetical protein
MLRTQEHPALALQDWAESEQAPAGLYASFNKELKSSFTVVNWYEIVNSWLAA